MRVEFYGVRGSTPAPGAEFVRYGGHTSCVGIAHGDEAPRLVLDAGTGLRNLSRALAGAPFTGTLLLGHLHWDHTHGIPFFAAGDHPEASVRLLAPVAEEASVEAVLTRMMSPPHFPITPAELRGSWSFERIVPGTHTIEGFAVLARPVPHKGGTTFGYRVSDGAVAVAYLSDHAPQVLGVGPAGCGPYHDAALELAEGVDLLIHDAQYTAEELDARGAFGHAAAEYAVGLGAAAGARRVLLFHHDPARTDDEIDAIAGRFPGVTAAAEGMVIDL